jgi:adenine phosphoribosyltransferase
MIESKIKLTVRDVNDFPKPGIVFKDITPILKDPALCLEITKAMAEQVKGMDIDVVAGIESRGFLFGPQLAELLNVPFVPIRKAGKLPYTTVQQTYDLEYGTVLIHDDLLATGGTVVAASKLVMQLGAEVAGYSFIIGLEFLNGRLRLTPYSDKIYSLASY